MSWPEHHPLYREAKLASLAAEAGLFEAMILHEYERRPVCTQTIEKYRAFLVFHQRFADAYRRAQARARCVSRLA